MFKIISENPNSNIAEFTILDNDVERKIYCDKWNGEIYLDCWEFDADDKPVDIDYVTPIYRCIDAEEERYELVGLEIGFCENSIL